MSEDLEPIGEKRTIKLTERAMEDYKTRYLKARKQKLSQISRMINHLDELMKTDENADVVKNKVRVDYHSLHQEFCEINAGLMNYMSEEDYVEDQNTWFEPKNKHINDYFWKCENWMKNVLKPTAQTEHAAVGVLGAKAPAPASVVEVRSLRADQVDNKSTRSGAQSRRSGSSHGSRSSTSSIRIKAELERASLQVKAAALQEKLAIEKEQAEIMAQEKLRAVEFETHQKRLEAEIKAKKEMHDIQTALAESEAKMEVLQKYSSQCVQARSDFSSDGGDNEDGDGGVNNDADGDVLDIDYSEAQPLERQQPLPSAGSEMNNMHRELPPVSQFSSRHVWPAPNVSSAPNPRNKTPLPTVMPPRASTALNLELADGPAFDSLCKAINQQASVTDYLVKNHKATLLPEIKISTFSGDPLQFQTFIRSIEHSIEGRTSDACDRLQFLLQYTSGQPHELVKSCIHMEPTAGYTKGAYTPKASTPPTSMLTLCRGASTRFEMQAKLSARIERSKRERMRKDARESQGEQRGERTGRPRPLLHALK